MLYGKPIAWTDTHQYLGVQFSSTKGGLFSTLYKAKEATARKTANVALTLEKYLGDLPPKEALQIYKARVAAHLTYGAELAVDVSAAWVEPLEAVEKYFLRRILHVHKRCHMAILYTETGLLPLRYVRVMRALKYLRRLLGGKHSPVPRRALHVFQELWRRGESGWLGDIAIVLHRLGVGCEESWWLDLSTVQGVDNLLKACVKAAHDEIQRQVAGARLPLLQARTEVLSGRRAAYVVSGWRSYLEIAVPAHRVALTRFVTGSHALAVEAAKWIPVPESQSGPVPRHWRVCRMCGDDVEDEMHIFWGCAHPDLCRLRDVCLADVYRRYPALARGFIEPLQFWGLLWRHDDLIPCLGLFIYEALELVASCPMYVPDWYV